MADGNNEVVPFVESVPNGHQATYNLRFYYLDVMNRRLAPLNYNTGCLSTPTSWRIELTCERFLGGIYMLSITLRRMSHSTNDVKVTFLGLFFDASGRAVVDAKRCTRRIIQDEYKINYLNIPLEGIRAIVTANFNIRIEDCHSDTDWQCVSKFGTAKASVNQNAKL